jgi:hypothetical protein
MSDTSNLAKSLRERFGGTTEDRLGKALSELLENPFLTGALGRAFDAREKAAQAQEVAMGALNIPSAADIERLTRRLRSVSYRLEGIEDGVGRLDRALSSDGVKARLTAIEEQLHSLASKLDRSQRPAPKPAEARSAAASGARDAGTKASPTAKPAARAAKPAARKAKPAARKAKPAARKAKPAARKAKPTKA